MASSTEPGNPGNTITTLSASAKSSMP
jgi:hypothetical protein